MIKWKTCAGDWIYSLIGYNSALLEKFLYSWIPDSYSFGYPFGRFSFSSFLVAFKMHLGEYAFLGSYNKAVTTHFLSYDPFSFSFKLAPYLVNPGRL